MTPRHFKSRFSSQFHLPLEPEKEDTHIGNFFLISKRENYKNKVPLCTESLTNLCKTKIIQILKQSTARSKSDGTVARLPSKMAFFTRAWRMVKVLPRP